MKTYFTALSVTLIFGTLIVAAPPEDNLLAGPTMEQEEVTNDDMLSRKLQETGKKNKLNTRNQQRLWMSSLEAVELTNEQKVKVEVLLLELKEARQLFHKTYGKEFEEIQKEHFAAKKNDNVISEESRKRYLELMEFTPDVTVYQEKAWVLLTQEQQKTFQTKYQALLEEEAKRKEERKKNSTKEGKEGGFSLKDSRIDEKKGTPDENASGRVVDSVDAASLRRIKFLRHLRDLEKN